MKKNLNIVLLVGLIILINSCGAQQTPQEHAPQPKAAAADVKPSPSAPPAPAQPAVPAAVGGDANTSSSYSGSGTLQNPPAYPSQIPGAVVNPNCVSSAGSGQLGTGILQTVGGFISGNYMQGTGGIINIIGGAKSRQQCK